MEDKVVYRVIRCHKSKKYFPEKLFLGSSPGEATTQNFFTYPEYYCTKSHMNQLKEIVKFDTEKEAEVFLREEKLKDFPYDVVKTV